MLNKRFVFLSMVIFAVALFRLVPHLPNFTPVLAIALFGGMVFQNRFSAFLVPLSAMLISDFLIGFHSQVLIVYPTLMLVVTMGFWLRNRQTVLPIVGVTLSASLLFYLITNFGVWLLDGMYPMNAAGLMASYVAGLPFLQYAVAGDLFYVAILFGGYALAKRNHDWLRPTTQGIAGIQ